MGASYRNYGPHIIENINQLVQSSSIKSSGNKTSKTRLLYFWKFLTFGLIGTGFVLMVAPKLALSHSMLQILSSARHSPLPSGLVKFENDLLYVPVKSVYSETDNIQTDGKYGYCTLGPDFNQELLHIWSFAPLTTDYHRHLFTTCTLPMTL